MKKATLDLLLERRLKREENAIKPVEIKSIGMSFNVVKLPLTQILGIMDRFDIDNGSNSEKFAMFKELAYMSIPLLRDKKLLEAYNCVEPTDIVSAVLDDNVGAVAELASAIMGMYGLGDGSAVDEIKN